MKEMFLINKKINREFQDVFNEWMKMVNELQHKLHNKSQDLLCIPWPEDMVGTRQLLAARGTD